MEQNATKLDDGAGNNPCLNIEEENSLEKVSNPSSGILVNELLVSIFEWLPPADRMRLEAVNRKWCRLARKWSWSNYTVFSYDQFSRCDQWKDEFSKFNSLFIRCGRFLKEVNFFSQSSRVIISSSNMCALLTLLPNLQHLNLHGISLSDPAFKLISKTYPCLISFGFTCAILGSFDGLTTVLTKCKRLEILQAYGSHRHERDIYFFEILPPALKYVYIGSDFDCYSFFEQLRKQDIRLESLEFEAPFLEESNIVMLRKINYTKLKYLGFQIHDGLVDQFSLLANNFLHLQALELDFYGDIGNWTDELFEEVTAKCQNLKHFGLRIYRNTSINEEKISLLANLPKLCSVHVHYYSFVEVNPLPVCTLFAELSLKGQLQYFHTSITLTVEYICQALKQCKNLTGIFSGQNEEQSGFIQLIITLDEIHCGELLPTSVMDRRILHTNCGNHSKDKLPQHPWAKFYANDEQVPSNKIGEEICFGGVSSRPSSALFW